MKTLVIPSAVVATSLVLLPIYSARAADMTATWATGIGNWSDSTKWDTNPEFPNNNGNTYDAVVLGGQFTDVAVDVPITMESLNQRSGRVTLSASLTLNDTYHWEQGSLHGPGQLDTVNLLLDATGSPSLAADAKLNVSGVGTWNDAGFFIDTGASLNLLEGAAFDINHANPQMTSGFSGGQPTGTFNNAGTISQTSTTDLISGTRISALFNNSGVVNIAGRMAFLGGGTSSGDFALGDGAAIQLGGLDKAVVTTLDANSSVTSAGTADAVFRSGTTHISGTWTLNGDYTVEPDATVNANTGLPAIASLEVQGTTFGSNGRLNVMADHTITGDFISTRGVLAGTGTTTVQGMTRLIAGSPDGLILDGRTLDAAGGFDWQDGAITINNGGRLINHSAVSFPDGFDNILGSGGERPAFENRGALTNPTGQVNRIETDYIQTTNGALTVDGTLTIAGNSTFAGTVNVSSNHTLVLEGIPGFLPAPAAHNFQAGTTVTGAGTLQIEGGTAFVKNSARFDGFIPEVDRIEVSGANVTFDNLDGATGKDMEIDGGNVTFRAAPDPQDVALQNLRSVRAAPNPQQDVALQNLRIAGSANVDVSLGAAFANLGGLFVDDLFIGRDSDVSITGGSEATFDYVDIGTNSFLKFQGEGNVNVKEATAQSGSTVEFHNYLSMVGLYIFLDESTLVSSGKLLVESNATVNVGSGSVLTNAPGGSIGGQGTIVVANGGEFDSAGEIAPGGSSGILTVEGNLDCTSTATLNIEIGGGAVGSQYDRLNVTEELTLNGTLEISLINAFAPSPSNEFFIVTTTGGLTGSFANAASGDRLATLDGAGSFIVNYGPDSPFDPNEVVLSGFEASEPSPRLATPAIQPDGTFRFLLEGPPGTEFVVEATEDFRVWASIVTNPVPPDGQLIVVDPEARAFPIRFYRAYRP